MKLFLVQSLQTASIEAMHSQIRLFEDAHRYINNKKGSILHAKMQHRSTVHINSINLG